ncbi:MAG TPA: SRPBCC family protein [Solirubrobacterales bacterium]
MTTLTGTLISVDDRPALRFERRLPHSVERVWRAVSEPAELSRWFVAPVDWTPEPGEVFESYGQAGEITEVEPPRLLAWTWGGERFAFELEPDGEGCLLVFMHVFDEREQGANYASGWEIHLSRLDALLAGGSLTVDQARGPLAELHDSYAERFDLDPETGRRQIERMYPSAGELEDGPRLRFRRRFAHPPERVFRAVMDAGERAEWFPADAPLEVVESEAPGLIVGTWFGDTLRFEIRADGDGSLLEFTHEFEDRDTSARTAAGWDRVFARLGALLAGEPLGEKESLEKWPEVHEAYAEAFGVDPEIGRRAFAEHPMQT